MDYYTITYHTNGGNIIQSQTVNAGEYKASITLGTGENTATANVEYEIKNATLTEVSVTQKGTLTYDGTAQTPQVNANATAVNKNKVTFTYSLTENGEFGAMPTFTNVADSGTVYFKASAPNHDTASGSFTVTMNKANQTAPAAPTEAGKTINSITLNTIPNGEYKCDTGDWQTSPTFTGLTQNKTYTFRQRYAADANHNASAGSAETVIRTANHTHSFTYSSSNGTITATCNGAGTCSLTDNKATLTIAAPDNLTYDKSAKAAVITDANVIQGTAKVQYQTKSGDAYGEAT